MTDPTTSERILEAVELLKSHNAWRRGEDDSAMPSGGTNPMLLGQAIDTIVDLVPELIKQRNDIANCLWSAEDQWGEDYLWTKWELSRALTDEMKDEIRK
jgi:hypothetical protein